MRLTVHVITPTPALHTFAVRPLGMYVEAKGSAGAGLRGLAVLGGQWRRRGCCLQWVIALLPKRPVYSFSLSRLYPVKKLRKRPTSENELIYETSSHSSNYPSGFFLIEYFTIYSYEYV